MPVPITLLNLSIRRYSSKTVKDSDTSSVGYETTLPYSVKLHPNFDHRIKITSKGKNATPRGERIAPMRAKGSIAAAVVALLAVAGCDMFIDSGTRIARAEKQIAAAHYAAARVELKKALADQPDNARAHFLLAEAALQLGDGAGALEELQRALDLGMPPAATADAMARTELAVGRYQPLLAQIDGGQLPLQEPVRSIYRGQALHGLQRDAEALTAGNLSPPYT